jgi:hypothetical protein
MAGTSPAMTESIDSIIPPRRLSSPPVMMVMMMVPPVVMVMVVVVVGDAHRIARRRSPLLVRGL